MKIVDLLEKCFTETVKFLLSDESHEIKAVAAPGLMTLADVALYRANEGQLTATVCAANDLLNSFLELKTTAKAMLRELSCLTFMESNTMESSQRDVTKYVELAGSFSRLAIEYANSAIERITRDRLAQSANLGSNNDSSSIIPSSATSSNNQTFHPTARASVDNAIGTAQETLDAATLHAMTTGRRKKLNPVDCWESQRLFCPDYIWADDVLSCCQRGLKSASRHPFLSFSSNNAHHGIEGEWRGINLPPLCLKNANHLSHLVRHVLPDALSIFKVAMESNANVSRRLYIVKCEYRAPFRAFLEAHNKLKSAPSASIVDQYLKLNVESKQQEIKNKRLKAKKRIDELLRLPHFIEAVQLEQKCEMMEVGMAQMVLPFSELARMLDGKKVKIHPTLPTEDLAALEECLRRLRSFMGRNSYGLSEIRSLLLDLQGVPRDDDTLICRAQIFPFGTYPGKSGEEALILRIQKFMSQLQSLVDLAGVKGGFKVINKTDYDALKSLLQKCSTSLDPELFQAQCEDWYSYVRAQHALLENKAFRSIADEMRQTEIELGIAVASKSALDMVRKRLVALDRERRMRFELLQDIMNDLSLREFGVSIKLSDINKDEVLQLPETSASGVFDQKLVMENELLPIG